jgi:hypothetical protein
MKRLQNAAESAAKGFGSRVRTNFKPPAACNSLALPTLVCYKPLNFFADVAIDRPVDSGFMWCGISWNPALELADPPFSAADGPY